MALRVCADCTAAYAVGLLRCPQCGSTDHQEDSMPKITRAGVSYEPGREPGSAAAPAAENADVATPGSEVPDAAAAAAAAQPGPEGPAPSQDTAQGAGTAAAPARAQPKKADT